MKRSPPQSPAGGQADHADLGFGQDSADVHFLGFAGSEIEAGLDMSKMIANKRFGAVRIAIA
jgi:hypothetical protein